MKGTAELDCICPAMNTGAAPVFHASGMHTPNLAQSQTNNHSAVKQPQRSQTTTAQSKNHSAVKQPQHSQTTTAQSNSHNTVKKSLRTACSAFQQHNLSATHMTQTSPELCTTQKSVSAATWSKSEGTEADWTSCLMMLGAPFKKSRAEPLGMPLDTTTTTPDLKLFELNSSTLSMESSAWLLEGWDRVGCLGRITVALSCITITTIIMMTTMMMMIRIIIIMIMTTTIIIVYRRSS